MSIHLMPNPNQCTAKSKNMSIHVKWNLVSNVDNVVLKANTCYGKCKQV